MRANDFLSFMFNSSSAYSWVIYEGGSKRSSIIDWLLSLNREITYLMKEMSKVANIICL